MNCFPCFGSHKSKKSHSKREYGSPPHENLTSTTPDIKKPKGDDPAHVNIADIQAQTFTFRELATATKNFRHECLLGEGGFGRVYKGTLPATGQVVAVKQLDRNGLQGNKEFLVEVLMLSLLHHESLVNLIGYCADGDQRLLVYEFVSGGSLEEHILGNRSDKRPLDWFTRMKIASSVACGLEYLHDKANPPVIYRDLKSSNILLDDDLNPKLSDFGLAKLAGGDKMNPAPSRVMGTYGYSAPEYVSTGHLTLKSDVYSFGVILLELITGRRAIDTTKPNDEQNLVTWAQPLFRDPKRFPEMADPVLGKHFPEKDLNQAVAIAAMCLQEEAAARPLMSDVVTALSFLSMVPPEVIPASLSHATLPSEESNAGESEAETGMVSDDEGSSYEDGKNDCEESYSKSSRKSSKRSRNSNSSRRNSIGSEEGSVCCSQRSRNETETQSSRTAHGGIGNVSSRSKERNEESERRASFGSNCSNSIERSGSRNKSLGLMRGGSAHLDDNNGSMRSHEANGKRLDHVSSRSSDEERLLFR